MAVIKDNYCNQYSYILSNESIKAWVQISHLFGSGHKGYLRS